MLQTQSETEWKRWFKLSRIIPMVTILGAGIAIVLSRLSIIKLTISESIIIALLALLAVDALKERIEFLEKIEAKIGKSAKQILRRREDLPSAKEQGKNASDICIISPAMATLSNIAPAFFAEKIQGSCRLRILLLNPDNSEGIKIWGQLNTDASIEMRIRDTLSFIERSMIERSKTHCEVRFTNVLIPFSMYATDMYSNSGSMAVEFHGYKADDDLRPHAYLTVQDDHEWFNHYRNQFELAWSDGLIWIPSSEKDSE